jgi:hypothetical protein
LGVVNRNVDHAPAANESAATAKNQNQEALKGHDCLNGLFKRGI